MPRLRRLSLVPVVFLAGCAEAAPPAPQGSRSLRIARLEEMARSCGLPAETVKLEGEDQLHVQPSPDASYDSIDCLLKALKKADMPLKLGFVGNEVPETGNQP